MEDHEILFFFQTENTELKEDIGSMNYWKK